jgi:hypothetical protein
MFKEAPRPLVTLLALVIASKVVLIAASNGALFPSLLWPLLFAALSLSALFGKQSAAKALGYVFYIVGVLSLLSPLVVAQSIFATVTAVAWGTLVIGTARYMFKSQAVKAFYSPGASTP